MTKHTCGKCGTKVDGADIFCSQCGAQLPIVVEVDVPMPAESLVTIRDDLGIEVRVNSVAEAKSVVKYLKQEKKGLSLSKREVDAAMRDLRAAYRHKVAIRAPAARGSGVWAKMIRGRQASERAQDQRLHAQELAPYQARKANIELLMLNIDGLVLKLDQYIEESK